MAHNSFQRRALQSCLLLAGLGWLGVASAQPSPLPPIVVVSTLSVAGARIYLSSLLTPESRAALPELLQLDKQSIGPSPPPGQARFLEGRDVFRRLEALGITEERYAIRVPDRIRVARQSQTVTAQDISEKVESEFLPRLAWDDVRLEEIGIAEALELPVGTLELTFQESPHADMARPFYLNINFWIDGQIVQRSAVRTVLAISHTVAVADRNLTSPGTIALEDVRWEKRRLTSTLRMPVSRRDFFGHKASRYRIMAGQILTEDMFAVVPLIKRGDSVVLVFEDGSIQIRAQGLSLAAGSKGERIRVMNVTSRREITGEVVDEKTVRVIL